MVGKFVLIVFLVLVSIQTFAQDNHYWTQQYGAENTSMGGAVVAGVRDNAAIYYNPGAMGFISNNSISVEANAYKLDKIFVDDGLGNGVNLNSNQLSIYPQIISGLFALGKHDRWKLSFALLTRQSGNILMSTRYADSDIPGSLVPQNEKFIGALSYSSQLNEQWLGIGTSYKTSNHFSFGGTLFLCYRAQSYNMTNDIRLALKIDSSNFFGLYDDEKSLKYTTLSGLFKFGVAYQSGKWKLGLTFTTPSLQFSGSGDIQRELSVAGIADTTQGSGALIMGRQNGIKATYNRPLSVGFGVEYTAIKTRVALSLEYFAPINLYHLFNTAYNPYIYPKSADTGSTHAMLPGFLQVENECIPVLNLALGFSQELGKRIIFLLGARTDFTSYYQPQEGDPYLSGTTSYELYHFSTGLSWHKNKNAVTLGFTYSWSPTKSYSNLGMVGPLILPDLTPTIHSSAYTLVLGYTFSFPN
jgi:hypothetical protein